jgi:DNA repair exonuclease SbcCD nuclease subunit
MIEKIAFFADLHIKLFKGHDDYREVWYNEFLPKLREISPQRVVFLGDFVHSKNQATPELFQIICEFLNSLTEICPVVMILGNHDLLLNNLDRLDTLSPIIKALNNDKITLHVNTGCYEDDNVVWCVWGITEGNTKPDILSARNEFGEEKHFIGLQHGPIKGMATDLNFIFEDGIDIEDFNECDAAFNGDVHARTSFTTTKNIPVEMIGSTLQLSHGERIKKHGFLEYNIVNKDRTYHELHNENVFMNYKIESIDDIEKEMEVLLNG